VVTRRFSPTFVLVTGLSCAVVAGALWSVQHTITDRQTILREANTLARSEPVREEFSGQIADAIVPHNTQSSPADINAANDVARKAVESPEFETAFANALPAMYAQVVDGVTGAVVLDPGLVNQAVRSTGATPPPDLTLRIAPGQLPDLRRPLDLLARGAAALGALAALLIGFGLATSSHRGRAVMRIGRWMITVGILAIVAFWALPTLALLPLGGWISVIGIVLATADWLAVPAAVMAAIGVAIVVVGRAGENEGRRRELATIPHRRNPTHASVG
jgi:hypothetical protein